MASLSLLAGVPPFLMARELLTRAGAFEPGMSPGPEPPPALAGDDAAREALRAHLAARLARYKLPRRFEFRAALPRDDAGKLLKRVLREPYWQGQGRRV